MSNGGDIIGDIAQGGLLARAAEPGHGEDHSNGHTREQACLNCGTALVGSHCHACGQAAHVHRTIGAFFHDLLHGVFHFEGKIWRTVPLLVWHPGRLTRAYIDGRRASYVSPIALFLFVVFLSFGIFNALGNPVDFNNRAASGQVTVSLAEAEADARTQLADYQRKLAEARAGKGGDPGALEREVEKAQQAVELIGSARAGKLPADVGVDGISSKQAVARLEQAWQHIRDNPELAAYKLQTSAYKYAWLVIPLSVPFVWLLFPFSRRFHLYDHTVFVTYSVSFQLLLLALVGVLMAWDGPGFVMALLVAYVPFHMYRQARETYRLSGFGAWWRTWFLATFAVVVLALFAAGLTVYTAA